MVEHRLWRYTDKGSFKFNCESACEYKSWALEVISVDLKSALLGLGLVILNIRSKKDFGKKPLQCGKFR